LSRYVERVAFSEFRAIFEVWFARPYADIFGDEVSLWRRGQITTYNGGGAIPTTSSGSI
jgi:hypothetical protein